MHYCCINVYYKECCIGKFENVLALLPEGLRAAVKLRFDASGVEKASEMSF